MDGVSDLYCAQLCDAIYGHQPTDGTVIKWDYLDQGDDDGINWGITHVGDIDVVTLRGSITFWDWLKDLLAVANPLESGPLGPVHPGFMLGMEHMAAELLRMCQRKVIVTGHSLGAGRACVLAGLMQLAGRPPIKRVCFGEPLPGFSRLAEITAGIPSFSYRNGSETAHKHDLVTDMPFFIPPTQLYAHPRPLIDVYSPAPPADHWLGAFRWHHMPLYVQALEAQGARQ